MIIISDPSADATCPVRIGRYTPVHSRSSPADNDTPKYTGPQRISVQHEEVTGSIPVSPTPNIPGQKPY
jgi:hypothetical protein